MTNAPPTTPVELGAGCLHPGADANATPPPGSDPTTARQARPKRTCWQSRLPWDDANLMAERRRHAQELGPLGPEEMAEHIAQRLRAVETTKPLCDQVRHDWLQGGSLLDIFDSGLWLRDPALKDKSFRQYATEIAAKVMGREKVSWQTVERRLLLAQGYSLEEAEDLGRRGACTTVLAFITTLDPQLRPLLLTLATEDDISSDVIMDIGRRAQRKLDKDPLAAAEATVRNALLSYEKDKEADRRKNGNRGNGQGSSDPMREAELQRREAELAHRERAVEQREQRVTLREEATAAGGSVSEVAERRLGEALAKEAEIGRLQAALQTERAQVAAQKEATDKQAAQFAAQAAELQRSRQELESLRAQLTAREAEVKAKEQGLAPAWKELEEKQASYQPREQDLARRIEQVQAREQEVAQKQAQLQPLENAYKEALALNQQEEQRLRLVAAELREARRQLDNGIIVVLDNPVDLESTLDCIGQEAERLADLAEAAEDQIDEEEGLEARNCKAAVDAWMKVEHAKEALHPVIKTILTKLGDEFPEQTKKALVWGETERKAYSRKRDQARREREQAAREAEAEEDEDE